jgi:hypothetical protein
MLFPVVIKSMLRPLRPLNRRIRIGDVEVLQLRRELELRPTINSAAPASFSTAASQPGFIAIFHMILSNSDL